MTTPAEDRFTPPRRWQLRVDGWAASLLPLLWATTLIVWTWMLLTPIPETVGEWNGLDLKFWIGKGLHFSVYAGLAILTWLLPFRVEVRWILVALLVFHGGLTEYLQQFVQRGSSWADWGRDTCGVALGLLVVRWALHLRRCREPTQGEVEKHRHEE